jgi:hypothetical protein
MDGEDYANSCGVKSAQTSKEEKHQESKDGAGADASKQISVFICRLRCTVRKCDGEILYQVKVE